MSKYKKVVASSGTEMFYIDGHRVKPADLPEGMASRLQDGVEVEIAAGHAEPIEDSPTTELENATNDVLQDEPQTDEPKEESDKSEIPVRKCFIDGKEGRFKRFLQLETVYLCDKHYHSLTSGEVVAAMRDKGYIE